MSPTSLRTDNSNNSTGLRKRLKSSSLRKRVRSSALYWRIKLFLKRISGREIWIRPDIAIRATGKGDYHYDSSLLTDASTVYSFGVGDAIEFELELIAGHGMIVHTFDPTPYALDWLETQEPPDRFKFYPWGVAGKDGVLTLFPRLTKKGQRSKIMWTSDPEQADPERAINVPAHTIPSLITMLGHEKLDLVKLDVEGAEYDALSEMLRMNVFPTQILVEFHHRFPGIGQQKTLDCIDQLRTAGYRIFWVSPTGREVSFIRRT